MKALVIGLGSMGKRRIRNLQELGVQEIFGYEQNEATAQEAQKTYGITLLPTLENLKEQAFGLAVISTPPEAHLDAAKACAEAKIPFFVELNLTKRESQAIQALAKENGVQAFASDTELFDSDISELSRLVGTDFKGYFVFHLGQNIHDWHPWQKAGEHFIFHPETNGIREMLRAELSWMLSVFGKITSISAKSAQFETKEYDVDDYMGIELGFENGNKGTAVFDLLAPKVIKRMDVVSENKIITWHERKNMFEVQETGKENVTSELDGKRVEAGYEFQEDAHLAEMKHVLAVLEGKEESKLTFENELNILEIIDRIEESAHKTS